MARFERVATTFVLYGDTGAAVLVAPEEGAPTITFMKSDVMIQRGKRLPSGRRIVAIDMPGELAEQMGIV